MAYKVKSGDTLSQIAKRMGTTIKALMAANPNIKDANKIRTGQTIKTPTEVIKSGPATAVMSVFGKDVKFKKKDGKYYRVKKDGTLAKNPASGLQAANLANPKSKLVTRSGGTTTTKSKLPKSNNPYAGLTKTEMAKMAMPKKKKSDKKMTIAEMEREMDKRFNERLAQMRKKRQKAKT
jgi:LysM repeat protein